MAEEDYYANYDVDPNAKLRDLEEKQRIMKDRLMLIGQNLIETKESFNEKLTDIKKQIEILKESVERMTSFLETASAEFPKFAKVVREMVEQVKKLGPNPLAGEKRSEKSEKRIEEVMEV